MSYHRRSSSGHVVVRRKGKSPIQGVAGTHFRSRKRAQEKADELNRAYEGSDVKFMVREKDWRRKRWWS